MEKHPVESPPRRVPPLLLWFAVGGGVAAWVVHLFVGWSFLELSCLGPAGPGWGISLTVYLATGIPWLVALLATVTGVLLRVRSARLPDDTLARERVGLLLVVGIWLNLLTLAAITGGGIALLVLDPCS